MKGYRETFIGKSSHFAKTGLVIGWLGLVMTGFTALGWYKAQPGAVGTIHRKWPTSIIITPDAFKYSLVIFAHPKCQCSDATLEELVNVLNESPDRLHVSVYFYRPQGSPADWNKGALWKKAEKITGVNLYDDEGGSMARHFGARTSGQTYLYDTNGDLMFAGGITGSRGHIGNNKGRQAIAIAVSTGRPASDFTNAFGCGLFSESEMKDFGIKPQQAKAMESADEDT